MINLVPLGGYVKLKGEERADADKGESNSANSFQNKSLWVKTVVFLAGIVMNLILAIGVFSLYLPMNGYTTEIVDLVDHNFVGAEKVESLFPILVVDYTSDDSAAKASGIQKGDRIVEVNGITFSSVEEFQALLRDNKKKTIPISLYDVDKKEFKYIEVSLPDREEKILGISVSFPDYPFYLVKYPSNILSSISHTYNIFTYQLPAIGSLISRSIQESDPSYAVNSVNGVVGVSAVVNEIIAAEQFAMLINIIAVISISLALFNLLPIPILDGGQLFLSIIESARRKKFSNGTIEKINFVSFVLIIGLTLLITAKDIWQFDIIQGFISTIRKILGIF